MNQYFGPVFHTTCVMKILNKIIVVYVVIEQPSEEDYVCPIFNCKQLVDFISKYPKDRIRVHNRSMWEHSDAVSTCIENDNIHRYRILINPNQFTIKHIPLEIR